MSKRPPSDQDEKAAEAPNEQPVQTPSAISSDSNVEEVSFLQSFDAAFESFEITSLDKIDHSELVQLLNTEETKSPSTPVGLAENCLAMKASTWKRASFWISCSIPTATLKSST